jgi:hypothetical protein
MEKVDDEIISVYRRVKEVPYCFPLHWGDGLVTRGHCGMKSELLAYELKKLGYKVRFVTGYRCGMIPRVLWPKFLDVHFWIEVKTGDRWLTLDPTPDKAFALTITDVQIGEHVGEPKYVKRSANILPWYKDVYNSVLILPYKVLVNMWFGMVRLYLRIKRLKHVPAVL